MGPDTYTATTSILGPSRGSPAAWLALLDQRLDTFDDVQDRPDEVRRYLEEVYRLAPKAGIRAELAVAQAIHETAWFSSFWWRERLNPAGIGITGDPPQDAQSRVFPSGTSAARAHLVHLALYAIGTELPSALKPYQSEDPRWAAARGHAGKRTTIADFQGTWAMDTRYAAKWVSTLNATVPQLDDDPISPTETDAMPTYPFAWPGLPGGPIHFSFPVYAKIVPPWRTNNRPGIKARRPRRSVQHSNGNPAALAAQDSTYLFNGAEGRQASWHGTVDHKEGYANLPADEIGWHASDGAGPGNYNGFAVELSEWARYNGTATQHRQARRNAAEMSGRVAARLDVGEEEYHRTFAPDKKFCPRVILENPQWTREYEADWLFFYQDEKKRMGGAPAIDTGFKVGDAFTVTADKVNVRSGAGTAYRIVGTLDKGRTGTIISDGTRHTTYQNGYQWVNVSIPGWGTGWMAQGFGDEMWISRTAAPAPTPPKPQPVYAPKSPIPQLLETNLTKDDIYNTAVAVRTVAEADFIFVADVIEFKRTSKAQQYAGDGGKEVMAPYQEGDRAIAAWITKVDDGTYWYVLTGGDDEWVRVAVNDTVRIADAPLLGDDMH